MQPRLNINPGRSALMARIRAKDTKPERLVRSLAHKLGVRFRLHRKDLPGTPDLTFPALQKVIFVHGCFWHQHPGCQFSRLPKTRVEYWYPKLRGNRARDLRVKKALAERGWSVMVVWECETFIPSALSRRLKKFLRGKQ